MTTYAARRRVGELLQESLQTEGWGWEPKFVNVGRVQLNSQNFRRFLNQSWRTPTAMISNGGVDVKIGSETMSALPPKADIE